MPQGLDERPAHLRSLDGGRERLLTVKEVAARLGVCRATAYEPCESGELPHIRVLNAIRVPPADVEQFVTTRRDAVQASTRRPPSGGAG